MNKMIFVNLPVADLPRSVAFYEAVGAVKNPVFSDETAACLVFSETIHAMLLTHEKFVGFTNRPIPDAKRTAQVLICVSEDSREAVDAVMARAGAAGGQADAIAIQDYSFMYSRAYADPDGHIWEVMWMDPEAAIQGPEAFAAQVGGG